MLHISLENEKKADALEMAKSNQTSDELIGFIQKSVAADALQLPILELEQYEPPLETDSEADDRSKGSIRYAWIGIGQCGGRMVESFYHMGYKKVLALNTAQHDLDLIDIPSNQKFLMEIGKNIADRNIEKSKQAVQKYQHEILHLARKIFNTRVDHIMICFGAGGVTGSVSIIQLIEVIKKYARHIKLKDPNKQVGVVMTLPALGELSSNSAAENTRKLWEQLSQMASEGEISPLVLVDNNKINRFYPEIRGKSSWIRTNNTFASIFDFFNGISALGSRYTSFDSADYHSIINAGGQLVMGMAEVKRHDNPFAISEAVKKSIENTLTVSGFDLSTAKMAGCIIVGGKKIVTDVKGLQDDIDYAFDVLAQITGQATVHRGIYEDERDSLRVFTIIGGLDSPSIPPEQFGASLYEKINVINLKGPPLKQRREDILPLAEYFLENHAYLHNEPPKFLSLDAKRLLLSYSWPGDTDELANTIKHACALSIEKEIKPTELPFKILASESNTLKHKIPKLDDIIRRIIVRTLVLTKGNKLAAAKILDIKAYKLNQLIEKLKIYKV